MVAGKRGTKEIEASVFRACPACGSTDQSGVFAQANFASSALDEFAFASRKRPEYMHHRLVECSCDLLYASPVPTVETLRVAYNNAAFDSGQEAKFASRTYAELLPSILARIPGRQGALDVGTGEGAFLERLLEAQFRHVVGIEPSLSAIEAAGPDIRRLIRHDFFRAGAFEAGTFDLLTCFQTLEHVHEPLDVCKEAHKLLKTGGAFFIVVHNRRAFSAKLLGRRSPIFDIEHLQLFSPPSARLVLERAGFGHVELKMILNRYPLRYWLKLLPMPQKTKSLLLRCVSSTAIGEAAIPLPAGNMALIGYK